MLKAQSAASIIQFIGDEEVARGITIGITIGMELGNDVKIDFGHESVEKVI